MDILTDSFPEIKLIEIIEIETWNALYGVRIFQMWLISDDNTMIHKCNCKCLLDNIM